ncbi:methionine ABC transporter ATP-binding protein [Serpentinicella alkaliphila]|uniref:D-methionine transport system ATP-binding protein n=1 Tax=Serpentinicella alkaliphila TaxID=1734049 RepID=A0A4R2THR4_9FIRM|nr:ATP-binding cassette domain-containing protein [Serpentinicella alkaliphila]QUH25125.1 ATP-binding cassette domain-containing protein [Serpentinicella alkaliphila]TCQ01772.1 D-methionine transport system ATP-binding protein [Serpentinicella alkaliphila]
MITLKNIFKTYKTKNSSLVAVNDVSLNISKGEIFGIIGYSGAGKSSLIRCVNLLEKPDKGQVIVNGQDLTLLTEKSLREARKKIGMIFQGFNLLKTATVYENISLPLKLSGFSTSEIDRRVDNYLSIVGLEDKKFAYPNQLSGGQKQRVAIARTLAHEPEIILSDEATSALDPETTESILELLLKINKEFGITILLITHEMSVIQKICDKVAVMENGNIVEQGCVLDIYSHPKHPTTKKFINSLFPKQISPSVLDSLKKRGPIVSLSFVGSSADKPLLATLPTKFNVFPNILSGHIIQLKKGPFGKIIVSLQGDTSNISESIIYLKDQGVIVEGDELENVLQFS